MSSLLTGVELHPRSAEEALHSLEQVVARLASRGDARAVFPDVYAVITRNVARELRRHEGLFQEPRWISRLAGRFAERYLETLAWSLAGIPQDCEAWEVAHGAAVFGGTFPLQDAALGISAHINFDLALGLWRTIEEFGDTSPERLARYKHDHDAVNSLLAASLPESVERLVKRYGCTTTSLLAGRVLLPLTGAFSLHVLGRWREQVWNDVLALLHARGEREQAAVVSRMGQRSGRLGQLLSLGFRGGRRSRYEARRPTPGSGRMAGKERARDSRELSTG